LGGISPPKLTRGDETVRRPEIMHTVAEHIDDPE